MSKEDSARYKDLFSKLDVNKDGIVEVGELAKVMRAQKNLKESDYYRADQDASKGLDFSEFMTYMQSHEQKLRIAFSDLDRNKDGLIEPSEVQAALAKLGVAVDASEAERLTKRIDKDGSVGITWEEWKDFFQFSQAESLEDLVLFWRQSLMIDIGDDLTVPPEFTEKEKQSGMWWRHLVSGGLAGAVSRSGTAPLDRLKILLQVHGSSQKLGIVSGFKFMLKEGGVRSMWRGNGVNILRIAPESAVKFAAYEKIKRLIKGGDATSTIQPHERFFAGASAGVIAQTFIYPMEVIKTRLAIGETGRYNGILDCGWKVYRQEGLGMLYRGYLPNVLGIIPYAGMDLAIYETLKQKYLSKHPNEPNPGVLLLLGCGTVSSTCGMLTAYPLTLLRTKMQAAATPEAKAGLLPLFKHVFRNEGIQGLYRGITPNFMRVLPAVSISYVIYEKSKRRLGAS
ncbi:hypothetical protein CAPTEDRAFT_181015 [Capitella teleta]|uniref:EF-hand domain-containing protein n=1 Tax=Capitella teleta TaxID=283909 RepID=R7T4D2_CAPTE|nr:hypothetical protein CAPTEDRAFT_181015 [Capitella teleta]|eukprot:ELT87743.1 hypothetical protein CAPTEDRAFT_181015 [Capitella teleta]